MAFSPNGKHVLTASADGTVRLWDALSGKELRQFTGHNGTVNGVAFTPDNRCVVSGGHDKTIRLWDIATGKELHRFEGHDARVYRVTVSPDGRFLVSAGYSDSTVRIWRLPDIDALLKKRKAEERALKAKLIRLQAQLTGKLPNDPFDPKVVKLRQQLLDFLGQPASPVKQAGVLALLSKLPRADHA